MTLTDADGNLRQGADAEEHRHKVQRTWGLWQGTELVKLLVCVVFFQGPKSYLGWAETKFPPNDLQSASWYWFGCSCYHAAWQTVSRMKNLCQLGPYRNGWTGPISRKICRLFKRRWTCSGFAIANIWQIKEIPSDGISDRHSGAMMRCGMRRDFPHSVSSLP